MAKLAQTFARSELGRWFYGRERSEQKILTALLALVVFALLWAFVWKPVSDWRTLETARQQKAHQLLDWLKANEQAARVAGRGDPRQSSGPLTPVVTRAAAVHEITVNRLQPGGNGVLSVALQQQSFNKIIAWIAQMEENNGVSVQQANFDRVDAPGYVNAQLRLN